MAVTTLTHSQAFNTLYSITTDTCEKADPGDLVDTWGAMVNATMQVVDGMNNLTDGQILIGKTSQSCPTKLVLSGDATMDNAGVVTIAGGAVTGAKTASATIAPSNLTNAARAQYLTAIAELDLNAASATIPIGLITNAATIVKAYLVYTVASSTGTGVTLNLGKDGSASFFYTGTSAVSQAQYTKVDITGSLGSTSIAANDFLIVSTSGSVATTGGRVLFCVEIATN